MINAINTEQIDKHPANRRDPMIKPFLKWAGGKRQLLAQLLKEMPSDFDCYYEPFLGGGAVFLELQPAKAVVGDQNVQLINTYLAIKNDLPALIELLDEHKAKNCRDYYYSIREMDRDPDEFSLLHPVEQAARVIYLNKTCYNGLYRVNGQGLFNVPYGANGKNPTIYNEVSLKAISGYLNNADITIAAMDFDKCVKTATKNDFIYFDPPYHTNSTNFNGYQAGGFNEHEQSRLASLFDRLSRKGVKAMLSNSDTRFIADLYASHKISYVCANRTINSKPCGRGKVNEILVKNYG